jgi:sulfur relay (sulfurtransferase) complex TusBCD TusD component (DsrE family)
METHAPQKAGLTIGILLTTSPEHQNSHTVCQIAGALLAAGDRVELFLMEDGIYNLVRSAHSGAPASALEALQGRGMRISLCTQSAESRGICESDCLTGIGWLSQHELSQIVSRSDRFLAFGG